MERKNIPNDLSKEFGSLDGRKRLIKLYGEEAATYFGNNENGEDVMVLFDTQKGIRLTTFQKNGFVRVNEYASDGQSVGETFEGRY